MIQNKPLSGIIPPLVTPLKDNETLDIESLERLIEHLIAGGVHGLFILGTTGEEQSLSYDVRKQKFEWNGDEIQQPGRRTAQLRLLLHY